MFTCREFAEVRVEVMGNPSAARDGRESGRVQIGSFAHMSGRLASSPTTLTRRYHTAKVQHFGSPIGDWWVRVHVLDDDRERARKLAAETHTPEGRCFW